MHDQRTRVVLVHKIENIAALSFLRKVPQGLADVKHMHLR